MPIPTPQSEESHSDFISRCMADSVMNDDFPDSSQRAAVCEAQWTARSARREHDRRPTNVEFRAGPADLQLRDADDDKSIGSLEGHAAVFGKRSDFLGFGVEIIAKGAFDDVMEDDVRSLWNHDESRLLGRVSNKTLEIEIDDEGLRYKVDLPDTSDARTLKTLIDRGDITESSFGFVVADDAFDTDKDGTVVRTINKFERLFDVSPVTFPAYPDTSVAVRRLELRKKPGHRDFTFTLMDEHRSEGAEEEFFEFDGGKVRVFKDKDEWRSEIVLDEKHTPMWDEARVAALEVAQAKARDTIERLTTTIRGLRSALKGARR